MKPQSAQRWWLGMTHFYLAMNHLITGDFDAALAEAAMADTVGKDIADPRLQTYAGFTVGWVEAWRGRTGEAIKICRRALEQAPDRVSRAYASMILGYALAEHGEHRDAFERLQPTVAELEGFGFPQGQALAAVFAAEALRRAGLILHDQGRAADAKVKRAEALNTFERIGAAYEAQRSR